MAWLIFAADEFSLQVDLATDKGLFRAAVPSGVGSKGGWGPAVVILKGKTMGFDRETSIHHGILDAYVVFFKPIFKSCVLIVSGHQCQL